MSKIKYEEIEKDIKLQKIVNQIDGFIESLSKEFEKNIMSTSNLVSLTSFGKSILFLNTERLIKLDLSDLVFSKFSLL